MEKYGITMNAHHDIGRPWFNPSIVWGAFNKWIVDIHSKTPRLLELNFYTPVHVYVFNI